MSVELSRRERKKDETRHRIFHAAIDLFREQGFEQTTVDDITEKADVAKGTFFNYFRRKEAVLAYLSESRLLAIDEQPRCLKKPFCIGSYLLGCLLHLKQRCNVLSRKTQQLFSAVAQFGL